jgi:hypothetical protein
VALPSLICSSEFLTEALVELQQMAKQGKEKTKLATLNMGRKKKRRKRLKQSAA